MVYTASAANLRSLTMVGTRCTYRNCTIKSDGKTHLFHYPVFDKVRCLQWLKNANRLEFLNLKVSQLKNRVVCQNHFKYDCFMNFKMDKLKCHAVPTEDGPYCDSSKITEHHNEYYPITLEDIEKDLCMKNKSAYVSMKYGDFLVNCELMDAEPFKRTNQNEIPNKSSDKNDLALVSQNTFNSKMPMTSNTKIQYNKLPLPQEVNIEFESKPILAEKLYVSHVPVPANIATNPVMLNNIKSGVLQKNPNNISLLNTEQKIVKQSNQVDKELSSQSTIKKSRVRIISQKKITEPVPLIGKLEPASPSLVLPLPNKRREQRTDVESEIDKITKGAAFASENAALINCLQTEKLQNVNNIKTMLDNNCNHSNVKRSSNSILKTKLSPEKLTAIQEKRKFNMKLRDIIEAGLNKLDEQEKNFEQCQLPENVNTSHIDTQASLLPKESQLPSYNEYNFACLEARIKKMEDNLLNKIDQNSRKIMNLKHSFVPISHGNRSVSTQTTTDDKLYKKQLYQEISKFLSPSTNSLIYEELFINKYAQNAPTSTQSSKRRKYR